MINQYAIGEAIDYKWPRTSSLIAALASMRQSALAQRQILRHLARRHIPQDDGLKGERDAIVCKGAWLAYRCHR